MHDNEYRRHMVLDYSRILLNVVLALSIAILVCWLALSRQDSKLYEADNVVCASQPLAITCWERHPR